jgi:hypothetical protein
MRSPALESRAACRPRQVDDRPRRTAAARRQAENPPGAPGLWGKAAIVKRPANSRFARPGCTDRASPGRRRGGARFG